MFDIEALKNTIIAALQALYNDNYPEIEATATGYLETRETRLTDLTLALAQGEISNEFFLARLKDELTILESELISLKVIGIGIAEDAINSILDKVKELIPEAI